MNTAHIVIEGAERTVFPAAATGHVVTAIGVRGGGRIAIVTDDAGLQAVEQLTGGARERAKIRCLLTDTVHTVERADCGLGCRCAMKIVRSE
jgi:acyl-CoA reductase-like NAD-dependent aldehyde dehydrogenase